MDRQALIDTARSMLGVPFRHEGRSRDGVDCYGLLLVVAEEHNLPAPIESGYGRRPSGLHMATRLSEYCERISLQEIQPGDILHMKWLDEPQHLAIVTNIAPIRIIHADGQVGKVVEHIVNDDWMSKVRGCYRINA